MKILKRYILELCFILSLPPFKRSKRMVVDVCGNLLRFTFLILHAIVTAVFICSLLIIFFLKRWTK